ncbi:MAG: DNA polymerase III subunit gamma/tau [Proteobacteria bacterium]|nr:DNA polymerase III subunit gamma/tau [Pseudomonadota bacterium]
MQDKPRKELRALFGRYRSQTFADLVGQPHITKTLQNALKMGRVGQAYLFCGPRGTGKTSSARIFAKTINCTGPDPSAPYDTSPLEPCNACASCLNITAGRALDVIEMDAASNTGIDDVRDSVIGKAEYVPVESRKKVYIIDEVHKLSSSAFAALLKTLEEPPAHLVFMLATTDPNDLPATILSRCQRFDYRRISNSDIAARVRYVCEEEGIPIEERAADLIAEAADGGLRDALVILEQAISFADGPITARIIDDLLGAISKDALFSLCGHILDQQISEAVQVLDQLLAEGRDAVVLARDMIAHARALLLVQILKKPGDAEHLLRTSSEMVERLSAQASSVDRGRLMRMAGELLKLEKQLRDSAHPRLSWEMGIITMAAEIAVPAAATAPPATVPASRPAPPPPPPPQQHAPAPPPPPQPQQHAPAAAPGEVTLEAFQGAWKRLLDEIRRRKTPGSGVLLPFLTDCRPVAVEGSRCVIGTAEYGQFEQEKLEARRAGLSEILSELMGQPVQLTLRRTTRTPAATRSTQPDDSAHASFVDEAGDLFKGTVIE